MKILQRIHTLGDRVPRSAAENVVNGVKTIMVNEPLRTAAARRIAKSAVLRRGPRGQCPAPFGTRHGQFETADGTIIRDRRRRRAVGPAHARCRESAASPRSPRPCRRTLGPAFAAAVDLIREAKGRVIVTGLGKSGHVGAQDRRDARLHRHAGLLRARRRSQPRRSRHDHRRRRHHRAVVVRRAAGDEEPRQLFQAFRASR